MGRRSPACSASKQAGSRLSSLRTPLGFAARIVHEALGLPLVTLHLQPTGFVSKHETPVPHVWLRSINRWPMPVKRLFVAVGDRLSDQALAPAVNDLRAEFGLLPVRNIVRAWYDQVAEGETIICLGDVTVDGEARRTTRTGGAGRRERNGSCSAVTTSTRSTRYGRSKASAGR